MKVRFLDLARQTAGLQPELDLAVHRVLSGDTFVGGEEVEAFEHEFATFCGAGYAVGVNSGTDALELALRALGIGEGDKVITAANTCVPTVAAIVATGATPVLVDPDPKTMTLDPERLGEVCGPRTRAVVPVHLYGRCADMESILRVAREHDLLVVEDVAQAHGARSHSRRAGTFGDAAAFSFYPTKNLGALGDAGAVVTRNREVAERARRLRSYGDAGDGAVERGRNSRLDPLQAAILRAKLPHLDGWNHRRRELAGRYDARLAGLPVTLPAESEGDDHVHHLYVVRTKARESFRERLARRGVETLVHYERPIHRHPAYASLDRRGKLRTSERLCTEVVSLPLYPELRDEEVEFVIDAVHASFRRSRVAG
ncbi:MAG: DegT/DnrJ/EryC1/StrS family aminotransferase [Actinobacteria bacterium]|nr:DegT/DnrJ/EryC1/StrS family aminotransferase [Actinomycetota bacterium]